MSEFVEVMKQYNRMNDAHQKGALIPVEASLSNAVNNPDFFEEIVMEWAAEHPEPVYPTWGEWFVSMRMLPPNWECPTSEFICVGLLPNLMNTPIPADLAQKLGIEPKVIDDGT